MIHDFKIGEIKKKGSNPGSTKDSSEDAAELELLPNKYIQSLSEKKIHDAINKKIDMKKPLLPQVEHLTKEEFIFFVKRPRHAEDHDKDWQLYEDPQDEWFYCDATRNLYINITVLEILALIWMYHPYLVDDTHSMIVKVGLFILGAFVVWPCLEYNAHRNDLHAEERLPEKDSGKEQMALFKGHLQHHVFMNAKYKVSMTLTSTIFSLI